MSVFLDLLYVQPIQRNFNSRNKINKLLLWLQIVNANKKHTFFRCSKRKQKKQNKLFGKHNFVIKLWNMKFGAKEKYILCPSCLIREYPTLVRASRAASSAATFPAAAALMHSQDNHGSSIQTTALTAKTITAVAPKLLHSQPRQSQQKHPNYSTNSQDNHSNSTQTTALTATTITAVAPTLKHSQPKQSQQ